MSSIELILLKRFRDTINQTIPKNGFQHNPNLRHSTKTGCMQNDHFDILDNKRAPTHLGPEEVFF